MILFFNFFGRILIVFLAVNCEVFGVHLMMHTLEVILQTALLTRFDFSYVIIITLLHVVLQKILVDMKFVISNILNLNHFFAICCQIVVIETCVARPANSVVETFDYWH